MKPKNKTATIPANLVAPIEQLAKHLGISFSKMVALMLEERLPIEQHRMLFLDNAKSPRKPPKRQKVNSKPKDVNTELNEELNSMAERFGIVVDETSATIQEPTVEECEEDNLDLPW